MARRFVLAGLFAAAALTLSVLDSVAQQPAATVAGEDVVTETADGVKLACRYFKAAGTAKACVMILPGIKETDAKRVAWDQLGSELATDGYHVLRLEWRGHGKSIDITPAQFWEKTPKLSEVNAKFVRGNTKAAAKNDLFDKDFKPGYYPMYVNDIMAGRSYLERKNDAGELNCSSIYLIGAADAAPLGFYYMTAEWKREAKEPNLPQPLLFIAGNRRGFVPANADPAGKDIAGAIWISP
ncbi:MAG: alpha/beta hydrolase, partial [Gemmataceae bacterium]